MKQVPNYEGRYTGQHEGNVPDHGMEGQMRDLYTTKSSFEKYISMCGTDVMINFTSCFFFNDKLRLILKIFFK
jgi:hypothetical protein